MSWLLLTPTLKKQFPSSMSILSWCHRLTVSFAERLSLFLLLLSVILYSLLFQSFDYTTSRGCINKLQKDKLKNNIGLPIINNNFCTPFTSSGHQTYYVKINHIIIYN